ncbi:hypothetical protein SAMN06295879_2147 [Agreia bicolorata]|uniref:Uncharacterized protein n=1 Tax=Agreia bicolorata TaxID=110935 RepID=A0A1T4Y423_9MICO|nr:hypothetical protein SAMN06295879_2147 [Agreia bicolorata]
MEKQERREAVKWGVITCGGALVVILSAYAYLVAAWSVTD